MGSKVGLRQYVHGGGTGRREYRESPDLARGNPAAGIRDLETYRIGIQGHAGHRDRTAVNIVFYGVRQKIEEDLA
jgi:hypothetical protein